MSTVDDEYPCLAVCTIDAEGYCTACGRPSLPEPVLTQLNEAAATEHQPPAEPDTSNRAD